MTERTSLLNWTDWLLMGVSIGGAALLILLVVEVLGWQAQPASPWGQTLAAFFYENTAVTLLLLGLGCLSVTKAVVEYRSQ